MSDKIKKLRVEFLEEYRTQGQVYEAEDRRTFTEPGDIDRALGWIAMGIATDRDGVIETGVRKSTNPTLEVEG